jgi:all-trans-retinol dehydrogenase (NAD+)
MNKLADKNVLITGAASGIGKLMAEYFADEGCHLAILDINKELLMQTKNEVGRRGVKVQAYECDISDEKKVDETIKAVDRDFPQIDILVNNAGIVTGKLFSDMSVQDFRKVMDVNVMGMVMMTKKILPQMMKRRTGQIVNVASTAGFIGMPQMVEYCASKFADIGFSDSLRLELKKMGYKDIKITIVCPYVIATGMFHGFKPLLFNPVLKPEKVARKVVKATQKAAPYLIIPSYIKSLYLMKLLPVGFVDWLFFLFGAGRAMENFVGKNKKK